MRFELEATHWNVISDTVMGGISRGRPVNGNSVLSPAKIHWLGIMIADNPAGPLALEAHAIEVFGNR